MTTPTAVKPAFLGFKMGLYAGLCCLVYFIALHLVNVKLLVSPWIFFSFVIIVLFKVAAAYFLWQAYGKNVGFKDALQCTFLVSVVSLFFVVLFFYLLFNVIEPSISELVKQHFIESSLKSFEQGRITQEQLDANKQRAANFNLSTGLWFMLYSISLFIGFFYALIFAAISRLIGKDIAQRAASN